MINITTGILWIVDIIIIILVSWLLNNFFFPFDELHIKLFLHIFLVAPLVVACSVVSKGLVSQPMTLYN